VELAINTPENARESFDRGWLASRLRLILDGAARMPRADSGKAVGAISCQGIAPSPPTHCGNCGNLPSSSRPNPRIGADQLWQSGNTKRNAGAFPLDLTVTIIMRFVTVESR